MTFKSMYYYSYNNNQFLGEDGFYHYLYQITNKLNGMFYIGVHSQDPTKKDRYMGTGKDILRAYKELGKDVFEKTILEYFVNHKLAKEKESELVDYKLTSSIDCYNLINGGGCLKGGVGTVTVRDSEGNYFKVKKEDPRYLSGELVGTTKGIKNNTPSKRNTGNTHSEETKRKMSESAKGLIAVKNQTTGECLRVKKDDPRYLSGELVSVNKGRKHSIENRKLNSERNKGKKVSWETKRKMSESRMGYVNVKDKSGNTFKVKKDDPRYLSGELISCITPPKITKEIREKLSNSKKGKVAVRSTITKEYLLVDKNDPRYLSGELVSVNTGKIIIYTKEGKRIKVDKDDPRLISGELKRKQTD